MVDEFERSYLERLLVRYDGNVTRAAGAAAKDRRAFFELSLAFLSNDAANQLHFVDVHAGAPAGFCCAFEVANEGIKAGIFVGDNATGAQVSVQNTTVTESGKTGLFAFEKSRLPGFTANSFSANGGAPVGVSVEAAADLDAASVYSGGAAPNAKQAVRVIQYAKPAAAVTLEKLDVPYAFGDGFPAASSASRPT